MNQKGSLSVETAVVFPLFLLLLVAFLLLLASAVAGDLPEAEEFSDGIKIVDSILRKAGMLYEILE